MSDKVEKLRAFVLSHLDNFHHAGNSGSPPDLPEYELYAQDYLTFAENELIAIQNERSERNRIARLINCAGHLKRAMDCQLDTFLQAYSLDSVFKNRNLKIEKKLDFLQAAGIFSTRSLARLNTIRNKIEHPYEVPPIDDIEMYYDLVSSFVAILQRTTMFLLGSSLEIYIHDGEGTQVGFFSVEYDLSGPLVIANCRMNNSTEQMKCDLSNPEEFAFFFKVWVLMYELESFASSRHVKSRLSP